MTTAKRTVVGILGIILIAIIAVGVVLYGWAIVKASYARASAENQGSSNPARGT